MAMTKDERLAQAVRDAWAIGDLRYKMHAGQRVIDKAWRKRTKKLFVVNCARRFGKTVYWCTKIIEAMLKCPNDAPQYHFGTDTRKHLQEFLIPALQFVLRDAPPEIFPSWDECYMKSENMLWLRNLNGGISTLRLFGLDYNPDSTRGNYSDGWVIDEAGFTDDLVYLYSSVITPQLQHRPGAFCVLSSTPSRTPAHPFRDFCERANNEGNYVKLTIFDNPLISPEERKRIREEDCFNETDWQREYMCEFVTDETLAIVPETAGRHFTAFERPKYFEYLDRYVAMDLGVKVDLTAVLFGFYDPLANSRRGKLYIEDEFDIKGPEMTTEILHQMIRDKEAELWPGAKSSIRRVSDSDNPLLLQDLSILHNLYFLQVQKDSLYAMVNSVRLMMKNNEIEIHERCKKLRGSLQYGVWNKQRVSFDRTSYFGHFDHVAALMYLVTMLDRTTQPVPRGFIEEIPDFERRRGYREELESKKKVNKIKRLFGLK